MATVVFEDVMVRTLPLPTDIMDIIASKGIALGCELHLDTDEGNAAMLKSATAYELFRKEDDGSLTKVFSKSV